MMTYTAGVIMTLSERSVDMHLRRALIRGLP